MTKNEPYEDTFGIGQSQVARHRMDIARRTMAECAAVIIDPRHMWEDWRSMHLRMFEKARAEFDRAQSVIGGA